MKKKIRWILSGVLMLAIIGMCFFVYPRIAPSLFELDVFSVYYALETVSKSVLAGAAIISITLVLCVNLIRLKDDD